MNKFLTYYMDDALLNLPRVIEEAKEHLEGVDFDTLVGTGFSGSIVIPALSLAMDKKFVLIRKETDDSHHGRGRLVGTLGERWVFVDDFISTGLTRKRVIEKIRNGNFGERPVSHLVGQYMYQDRWGDGLQFEPVQDDWTDLNW